MRLKSMSENSLRDDHNSPSPEIILYGENTISVQPASHGLNWDQENIILMNPLSAHNQTFMTCLFKSFAVDATRIGKSREKKFP